MPQYQIVRPSNTNCQILNTLVKNQKMSFFVIPEKAGIQ